MLLLSAFNQKQPNTHNMDKRRHLDTINYQIMTNNIDQLHYTTFNCRKTYKTHLTKCKYLTFDYFYINMLFYSNGFYKFLTRFSGRRRCFHSDFNKFISHIACFLVIFSLFNVSEACSSRTVPKQRPPPTPTPRPNITFHTYKCPPNYDQWYCLNSAKCFTVKFGDEILYNCECADGYIGPRCEFKELDGSLLPTRPRAMLETASIASGATLALILVLILCLMLYMRWQQRQKLNRLSESGDAVGVDTVDGVVSAVIKCERHGRRPFGPHHYETLPMTATLKR